MAHQKAWQTEWAHVVAKAWADAAFKKRLLADPGAVLKEAGLDLKLPAGVQLHIVEDTDSLVHIILPAPPSEHEISEEQLAGRIGYTPTDCLRDCVSHGCAGDCSSDGL